MLSSSSQTRGMIAPRAIVRRASLVDPRHLLRKEASVAALKEMARSSTQAASTHAFLATHAVNEAAQAFKAAEQAPGGVAKVLRDNPKNCSVPVLWYVWIKSVPKLD